MSNSIPSVSIGLPVFNGEKYLKKALDSVLQQSYKDFELIISDNASTDKTEDICREYMRQDDRVRYIRNKSNLGAAGNFNQTFRISRGKYFIWLAHDDIYAPDLLKRSVEVLENDADIVLAYSKVINIDDNGEILDRDSDKLFLKGEPDKFSANSSSPHIRFRTLLLSSHKCYAVFGLMRSNVLSKTGLIGSYVGSDRVLLAELSLLGRFFEIDDYLFYHRQHQERSMRVYADPKDRIAWFDPEKANSIVLREWKILKEFLLSIWRVPLGLTERLRCCFQLIRWIRWHKKKMLDDVVCAIKQIAV